MCKGFKRKKSRSFIVTALLFIFVFTMTGCSDKSSETTNSKVKNNNNRKSVSTKVEDGKVYASLKEAFEYVGGECKIEGKSATATKDKDTIKVVSDSKEAELNSTKITMTDEVKNINNDLYVSMSFLKEVMDARVSFDEENKVLNINTEMPLSYTKGFSVTYLKGGLKKVVDGDKRTLILVPQGKIVPEEYKNEIVVNMPIKDVMLGSTTQACLLRPIKELETVKAVTTEKKNWTIPEIINGLESGATTFVGTGKAPDYEKISTLKPSIAFVYSGPSGQKEMMDKFNELKISYAVDNDYLEEDPFGRMEWLKFVAAFYDKEEEAEKYFNEAVSKVQDIAKKVSSGKKPKVAWGMISKGEVYVPKSDSYAAKMIELGGGDYIFKSEGVGNAKISIEEFYAKAKEADVFVYASTTNYAPTLKGVLEQAPILENLNSVQNKNVWCFHADYYQSLDKTDELILDLVGIFQPEVNSGYDIKHYVKYKE
ncbi:ABC transporter substrate-binding protein [Clostridium sp. MSJ-4]|uniref:ABC transporter substrate-binding protein n=1 Tax=Clostridium simiarum TaxID=2841506 RepID=A0ABS6F2E1_9CLOT|nr:ABC transporter substrate-binding protein [Clostridium simiarum]MBU5592669.1 ABC transporter substrate-binding protein [Clostridium simiarum]